MVVNSFQILTVAMEEQKLIHKYYVDSFGYEGFDLYNNILSNIPENAKKDFPFVNMCLREWRERLEEENKRKLWANMSCFDFDSYLSDEMNGVPQERIRIRNPQHEENVVPANEQSE